jgi:hypothetical protein
MHGLNLQTSEHILAEAAALLLIDAGSQVERNLNKKN